jgi:Tfp pilus assembly protein PilF
VGLSGFYWNPVLSTPNVGMWLTMLLILGGILAFTWISLRREPLIGLAEGLLVLPLFPVLAGMRSFSLHGLAHDRYLYLPSVGVCLLIGLLGKVLWGGGSRTRFAVGVAGSCLILSFVWLNLTQQNFYLDDDRFYQRAVDIAPQDARVRDLWGDFCFSQKRLTRAIELFSQAHEIEPDNPMVTGYLVKGLFANQEYAAAKPYLEDLVQDTRVQGDQHLEFMVALAQVQIELGHLSAAEGVLEQARNEGESHPGLHFTLGTLYQREGKIPEAQSEYAQEYQVSGNIIAGQRAMELERQMRSNSAHSPSEDSSASVPKK